jgi:hypothetical protein
VLDPRIVLPSRSTLTSTLLPELYEAAKSKLHEELDSCKYVALTTDGWSSNVGDPYITVTVHYVTKNLKMMSRVLTTSHMPQAHTGENICKFLKETASVWRIENKIVAVVTDNAANVKEAVRLTGWKSILCFAHTLNLVVKDALKDNKELETVLTQCRDLVAFFKRSPKAYSDLKRLAVDANLGVKTLKQEVPTRWNSTVIMLRSIVALTNQIDTALAKARRPDLVIDNNTTDLIKVCDFFGLFYFEIKDYLSI